MNFLPRVTTVIIQLHHVVITTSKRPTASAIQAEIFGPNLAEISPLGVVRPGHEVWRDIGFSYLLITIVDTMKKTLIFKV